MRYHRKIRGRTDGFSLIELSLMIMVLGLMAAAIFSSNVVKKEQERIALTQSRLDEIEDALKRYHIKRGYLPCPARTILRPGEAGYGAATDCSSDTVTDVIDEPTNGTSADSVRIGSVPTLTLSLEEDHMYDGWGGRFTYGVIRDLADPAEDFDTYTTASTDGVITIEDETGTQLTDAVTDDVVAYVLISHGKDRRGATRRSGTFDTAECQAAEAFEEENCDHIVGASSPADKVTFVDTDINETVGSDYFYDFIRWKTYFQVQKQKALDEW